jgi:hypothetical protein
MVTYLLLGLLLLLALLGPRFGADTRDGQDWWSLERRLGNR